MFEDVSDFLANAGAARFAEGENDAFEIDKAVGQKLNLRGLSAPLGTLKRHEKPRHPAQFLITLEERGIGAPEVAAVFAAVAVPARALGK